MSNKAKRIEQKTQFRFPLNMYTEMYGSLFIICHMFAEKKMTMIIVTHEMSFAMKTGENRLRNI